MYFSTFSIITRIHCSRSLQSGLLVLLAQVIKPHCSVSCRVRLGGWRGTEQVPLGGNSGQEKSSKDCDKVQVKIPIIWTHSCNIFTARTVFTVNPVWHECSIKLTDIFTASCSLEACLWRVCHWWQVTFTPKDTLSDTKHTMETGFAWYGLLKSNKISFRIICHL